MKPQIKQRAPFKGRNRDIDGAGPTDAPAQDSRQGHYAASAVPRMLRRMTRQSFMDVDLNYMLRLDPNTPDPFENSSPLLSDPPSLFRPLPPVAAAAQAIAQGAAPWTFHEAARLQKEQEDLRVQYLQFLHQLHLANPHGFLAHMNTFATQYPQEFLQLQSYIQFQEQLTYAQREEQRKQEELLQYQLELEKRNKTEQDLRQFQEFQELQQQKEQQNKQETLLQEWLMRRQKQRAVTNRKDMDLADLFTLAFQRDHQLVSKVAGSPGGIDWVLTPQQQFEFGQFLQAHQMEEEKRQKEAVLGSLAFRTAHAQAQAHAAMSSRGGLGAIGSGVSSSHNNPLIGLTNLFGLPTKLEPPMPVLTTMPDPIRRSGRNRTQTNMRRY
ncbi:hypothetical protein EDD11_007645 [Mortierella claussenii]|nr:hypothetical protein EDD11_007645 [Mortierella claussenii]